MSSNSSITIPSPEEIQSNLFSNPGKPPPLPEKWSATALLTPFGGLTAGAFVNPSDQLVVARIYYDGSGESRYLRTRLYLLESNLYYDFVFETTGNETTWYWLISDPADQSPNAPAQEGIGPFPTSAQVPLPTFLANAGFSYVGTWNVVNQPCDGFSASGNSVAGTWFSFFSGTNTLSRIMNVDDTNDFEIPVLGAYYLANFPTFEPAASLDLAIVARTLKDGSSAGEASSQMLTLADIQTVMNNPPPGVSQVSCTPTEIAAIIPGISFPSTPPPPPAWTDQMQSFCYMMGQDAYPYYSQVYYDYTGNKDQISVFVTTDGTLGPTPYNSRQDMVLPLGTVGPALNYIWNETNAQWQVGCYTPGGGYVPMSVPNFVQSAGGLCRAVVVDNPYFGEGAVTVWSVALGGQSGWSDFWYWFDAEQRGVVFSLAPAASLTMIDYQTFVQNASFPPGTFDEPTSGLPVCPPSVAEKRQKLMLIPKGGFGTNLTVAADE
jgi:hypothetical protein